MSQEWFAVDQPNSRFSAEACRLFGPFYRARVLDTETGEFVPLANFKAPRRAVSGVLTGRSSVRRAVKYGIEHELRRR